MSETESVPMSNWEWDGVVNDPKRMETANARIAQENQRRAQKEMLLSQFHQKNEVRRKSRVEVEACRYATGALAAGVVAYYVGTGGVDWLAWALGSVAAVLALIAAYGFGKVYEMGRR